MVTPENGTVKAVGVKTGQTYTYDIYSSDVIGAAVTFNQSGAAASTSPQSVRAPMTEDIVITDISIATGQTVSTGAVFTANSGVVNGGTIRWANYLNTINTRPALAIRIRAGDFLGATQF